jgi:hypothetical protein
MENRIAERKHDLAADDFRLQELFVTESAFRSILPLFNLLGEFEKTSGRSLKRQSPRMASSLSRGTSSLRAARVRFLFPCSNLFSLFCIRPRLAQESSGGFWFHQPARDYTCGCYEPASPR